MTIYKKQNKKIVEELFSIKNMAIEVLMPALSPTMEEGNIAKWLKKEGDVVKSGDVIAEIETDKATMEVEATDGGTLGKIVIGNGVKNVKVNTLIAVILEKGEDKSAIDAVIAKHLGGQGVVSKKEETKEEQKADAVANHAVIANSDGGRIVASPLAKRIAEEKNVNLANIAGTGPNGRIVKKDVENVNTSPVKANQSFVQFGRNTESSAFVPHSTMRRVIAKRLTESKQTVPHFYLSVEVSVKKLNKLRKDMNEMLDASGVGGKISVNDIIVKACGVALSRHPNVNASWSDDGMIVYNNVDISIAVGIPDGLITPIVKNVNLKGLAQISKEAKDLIKRARDGKLALDEFQGGGFTISNLGMYNISHFCAIINPPQSAILAVGGTKMVPYICKKSGELCEDEIMTITLSCDHRVVDGVLGAEFVNTIKDMLENPGLMVL